MAELQLKLCVLGASRAGKTLLCRALAGQSWSSTDYQPTAALRQAYLLLEPTLMSCTSQGPVALQDTGDRQIYRIRLGQSTIMGRLRQQPIPAVLGSRCQGTHHPELLEMKSNSKNNLPLTAMLHFALCRTQMV
jgi:hypothetical protein